jgi:hypothetical protein
MAARRVSQSAIVQDGRSVSVDPTLGLAARLVDQYRTPHREVAQLRVRCWLLRAEPAKYVHTYA